MSESDSFTHSSYSDGPRIKPLMGPENYAAWKEAVIDLLMEKELYDYTQSDPTAAHVKKDRAVGALIRGRLDQSLKHLVPAGSTAKAAWDAIVKAHEKVDQQYVMGYWSNLCNTKWVPGTSMKEHITKMRGWATAMEAAGSDTKLSDALQALSLLQSLPPTTEWKALTIALTHSGKAPTFASVASALQLRADEDAREEKAAVNQPALTALVSGSSRGDMRCHWCNIPGHKEVDCKGKRKGKPHWKTGEVWEGTRSASAANTAASSSTSSPSSSLPPARGINAMAYVTAAHRTPGTSSGQDGWVLDSGADEHFCCRREWFTDFSARPAGERSVIVGGMGHLPVEGVGTVTISLPAKGGEAPYTHAWNNVAYVPRLGSNLLGMGRVGPAGLTLSFEGDACQQIVIRTKAGQVIGHAVSTGGKLYAFTHGRTVPPPTRSESVACVARGKESSQEILSLWHERLAHLNPAAVVHLFTKGMAADGEAVARALAGSAPTATHCEPCVMGKHHRSPVPLQATDRATRPLYRLHVDLCGPMTPSYKGTHYLMLIVDDFSRFTWMTHLSQKSDALSAFIGYVAAAEAEHPDCKVARLRSDNGGEFISHAFNSWLATHGIKRELTVPYSPFQNGVVERMNRTVVEGSRTLLQAAGLPLSLWPLSCYASVYSRNRAPTTTICDRTPFEAWYGVKPNLLHMRRFGCPAYDHVRREDRAKMAAKAERRTFVGYALDSSGYLLWDGRKVVVSRDVHFVEGKLGSAEARAGEARGDTLAPPAALVPAPAAAHNPPVVPAPVQDTSDDSDDSDDDDDEKYAPQDVADNSAPIENNKQRAARIYRENQLKKLTDRNPMSSGRLDPAPSTVHSLAFIVKGGAQVDTVAPSEPRSFKEALDGPQAAEWKKAGDSEINSLLKADTYTLVPRPTDRNVIGNKMVLKIKRGKDGTIIKFKCRLVAKGYLQRYGVDYVDTYAPVARLPSIRALIALTAHHDLELHQMDVKSAYLNGDLEEEIFMEQPEGYVIPGKEHLVCKLQKSLYGLKQAGRTWHHKIDVTLKGRGFAALEADHCIYVRRQLGSIIIIALYVDDLLIAASRLADLSQFKQNLAAEFDMEDLGEASFILGIELQRDRNARTISITQSAYVTTLLDRHGMANCNPVVTPMEKSTQVQLAITPNDHQASLKEAREYQSIIGGIMYAMLCTRPDIAFAVTTLSQFASNPSELHRKALQRVLRYLRGTIYQGITYRGEGPIRSQPELLGYSDSDWGQRKDRRSITGYVFLLCGGAVSWQSKKQKTVALSTVEAEYMATTQAAKEAIWWRCHLSGLGYDVTQPTTLLSDSQGSIALAENPDQHARTKHIDIQYHFIRQHLAEKTILLRFIGTADMAADILTKALERIAHCRGMGLLGMRGA